MNQQYQIEQKAPHNSSFAVKVPFLSHALAIPITNTAPPSYDTRTTSYVSSKVRFKHCESTQSPSSPHINMHKFTIQVHLLITNLPYNTSTHVFCLY